MARQVYARCKTREDAEARLKEMLANGILKPEDNAFVELWLGVWSVVRK